jgi:hypothetical protein
MEKRNRGFRGLSVILHHRRQKLDSPVTLRLLEVGHVAGIIPESLRPGKKISGNPWRCAMEANRRLQVKAVSDQLSPLNVELIAER